MMDNLASNGLKKTKKNISCTDPPECRANLYTSTGVGGKAGGGKELSLYSSDMCSNYL